MITRARRCWAVLVVSFGLAGMMGACASVEPDRSAAGIEPTTPEAEVSLPIEGKFPPKERLSLGASPAPPREPAECSESIVANPCKKYRIQLQGDTMNGLVRAKYKAAFGSACYVSVSNTFDCFYKDPLKACDDGVLVPDVYGAAAYDKTYKCQQIKGTMDWWRQVGPDPSIKIDIKYQDAPLETSDIDVNGVPTAINGPYRNLPEPSKVLPGKEFHCYYIDGVKQKERILQVNRDAHVSGAGVGEIHSDLAGFKYPCNGPDKEMCEEPLVLKEPSKKYDEKRAEVHHVTRRTDLRGCPWGTNSNKNAVVISAKLNGHLKNKYPTKDEVDRVNLVPAYPP